MRRQTIVISALALCFALMCTACAARRPLQTPAQPGQDVGDRTGRYTGIGPSSANPNGTGYGEFPSYYGGNGGYGGYNNGMYGGYGNDYRNIRGGTDYGLNNTRNTATQAERLARSCEAIPGVNDATCVISGNTCYIGVDRNTAYGNANDLPAIKQQCTQKVKAANPQIETVYVSTDANFFDRLRRISDGAGNGNIGESFRNELNELVRGLTPERLQQ